MEKYYRNPYIVIGVLGLLYSLYKRREVLKVNPKAEKSIDELEKTTTHTFVKEEKKSNLPKEFIDDVKGMDNTTLKQTFKNNKEMLKRTELDKEKKQQVREMLLFIKNELSERNSN